MIQGQTRTTLILSLFERNYQNFIETPANMRNNISPNKVEPSKGSKEFTEADGLTVEVVRSIEILEAFFKEKGYDEWLCKGVCSRKLLEKVQQRMPILHERPITTTDLPMQVDGQILAADPQPYNAVTEGPVPMTEAEHRAFMRDIERARVMRAPQVRPVTEPGYPDQQYVYDGPLPRPEHRVNTEGAEILPDAIDRLVAGQASVEGPANDPALDTPF